MAAEAEPTPTTTPTPQTVGYKTFANAEEAKSYFRHILTNYSRRQDTNAYEFQNILSRNTGIGLLFIYLKFRPAKLFSWHLLLALHIVLWISFHLFLVI